MNVRQLIKKLKALEKKHGNVDVHANVKRVVVKPPIDETNVAALVDKLRQGGIAVQRKRQNLGKRGTTMYLKLQKDTGRLGGDAEARKVVMACRRYFPNTYLTSGRFSDYMRVSKWSKGNGFDMTVVLNP